MRVFVLCTGRCGSTTFARACSHITNYTSGHETRSRQYKARLNYPDQHIEVDNRLAWMLGMLDARYGTDPLYIHLERDFDAVLDSYTRRAHNPHGIVPAFAHGIIQADQCDDYEQPTRLMLRTVKANIRMFLRDKPNVIRIRIEEPHRGFDRMWDTIGAQGDRDAAHAELDVRHNARRQR